MRVGAVVVGGASMNHGCIDIGTYLIVSERSWMVLVVVVIVAGGFWGFIVSNGSADWQYLPPSCCIFGICGRQ